MDVGVTNHEYSQTDNFLEKHYPYLANITALTIEPVEEFTRRYPAVTAVTYDGGAFPFSDKQFDLVWSNAVLEHVGDARCQVRFLREIARTGANAFITTPNRWFPIEVHTRVPFVHWLPRSVTDRLLRWLGKDWAAGEYMRLLSRRQIKRLLRQARITDYTIYSNRLCGLTMDFVIVIRELKNTTPPSCTMMALSTKLKQSAARGRRDVRELSRHVGAEEPFLLPEHRRPRLP